MYLFYRLFALFLLLNDNCLLMQLAHDESQLKPVMIAQASLIFRQQLLQELQPRIHHAKPLVMPGEILALLADDFTKPFLDTRIIDIVVVAPSLIARIVRRIDVNALDLALVFRQKRLEREQVVAVDDHVTGIGRFALFLKRKGFRFSALCRIKRPLLFQNVVRHINVMIDHVFLTNPLKFHCRLSRQGK